MPPQKIAFDFRIDVYKKTAGSGQLVVKSPKKALPGTTTLVANDKHPTKDSNLFWEIKGF